MGFQTLQHQLEKLLEGTSRGEIQLPDFQRGYVWDDERVRQLLVTIGVGHPLGVILLLETGSSEVHFQSKPVEGTTPQPGTVPDRLILDGQQRLTSLTQALTGSGVVKTKDDGERRYFIKVEEALKNPEHLGDALVSVPASGKILTNFNRDVLLDVSTREREIAEGYFPVSLVFSSGSTHWAIEWVQAGERDIHLVSEFVKLLEGFKQYKIPAIELDKHTSMEAVTTVFEKVNQGGVKLTVFELLTAKFAGDAEYFAEHQEAFRLADHWRSVKQDLQQFQVLEGFRNDDFLQAVTLLASRASNRATTARKEDILKLKLVDYRRWAPEVVEALKWTARFLKDQHFHTSRDLPYQSQLVPLTCLKVILGREADTHGVVPKLQQWFWCGVLGELYGSASETRMARDVEQVPAWALSEEGVETPKTVDDCYTNESRFISLRSRNSAAYKGIYALLMAQGARDWMFDQTFDEADFFEMNVDIHHIFPKAWCGKNEIRWDQQESIVNKTPLARLTNQKLSGKAPSLYRRTLLQESRAEDELIDRVIATHQINTELLWRDDFATFFRDRSSKLCDLVEQATGKPVNRDGFLDELEPQTSEPDQPLSDDSDTIS